MGKFKHLALGAALAMSASVVAMDCAQADILGTFWSNVNATNASPSALPGLGAPSGTFTAPAQTIFSTAAATIGDFVTGASPFGLSGTFTSGAGFAGTLLNPTSTTGTVFELLGSVNVTTGETLAIGHDDGVTLIVGGSTIFSSPGPTGFAISSGVWTGATGTYAAEIVYAECCGLPADLVTSFVVNQVPEASTWAMMLAGFAGLGLVAFRRSRKSDISIAST